MDNLYYKDRELEKKDQDIKRLITNLFQHDNRLSNKYNSYNIEQIWRETFGHLISNYTTKVKFYKGTLTVYVSSAPLRQEIAMTKDNIIDKLNANLRYKKVTELIVR